MQRIAPVFLSALLSASLSFAAEPIPIQAEVWFSPQGGARDAILESIASAKKDIYVGAYKLEDKLIAKALAEAKNRGIAVSVLLEKRKANTRPVSGTGSSNKRCRSIRTQNTSCITTKS